MKIKYLLMTALFSLSTQSFAACNYTDHFFVHNASTMKPAITNGPTARLGNAIAYKNNDSSFDIHDTTKHCPSGKEPLVPDTYVTVTYAMNENDYCVLNIIDSPYLNTPDESHYQCHGNLNYAGMRHASGNYNYYFVFFSTQGVMPF